MKRQEARGRDANVRHDVRYVRGDDEYAARRYALLMCLALTHRENTDYPFGDAYRFVDGVCMQGWWPATWVQGILAYGLPRVCGSGRTLFTRARSIGSVGCHEWLHDVRHSLFAVHV